MEEESTSFSEIYEIRKIGEIKITIKCKNKKKTTISNNLAKIIEEKINPEIEKEEMIIINSTTTTNNIELIIF